MVRLVYILAVLVMLVACTAIGLCLWRWHEGGLQQDLLLQAPSAVQRFAANARQEAVEKTSPLLVQAQAYARLLDPPRITERVPVPAQRASFTSVVPPVRPATASANFKAYGTSYYPNEPGRSMALIAEPGAADGQERWVKEGTQIGHFVIHEIRRGMVVYRDGEQLHEMAVEHKMSRTSLVRGVQEGSLKVSAAVGNAGRITAAPVGPNDIGIASGN